MTLRPYGQIDMIQLHWESIVLSHQCVTTVFAGWSFRTVWNITYLSKCLFNPLMTSDELWIPIIVITFLSMAQPMKLGTNSPNLCHQKMHIILSEPDEHTESLYYIPKWNWYLFVFPELHSSKKCPHNKMSSQRRLAHVLYMVQTIFREHILFCDSLEIMSLDTGTFFVTTTSPKAQRGP